MFGYLLLFSREIVFKIDSWHSARDHVHEKKLSVTNNPKVEIDICLIMCMRVLVTQSCLILCNPMNYYPPGSLVHGNVQARILEWVAIPFFRGSPQPRDQTWISCIAGRFFTIWATRGAYICLTNKNQIIYSIIQNVCML